MTVKRFTYMIDRVFDLWGVYDNNEKVICLVRNTDAKDLCDLLNELHEENQIKLEIVDAFIRGLEDEKGIDSENKEFQCRMNFTIKVLKKLKEEMLDPTDFKQAKELLE